MALIAAETTPAVRDGTRGRLAADDRTRALGPMDVAIRAAWSRYFGVERAGDLKDWHGALRNRASRSQRGS